MTITGCDGLPMSGTASLVFGIISDTIFMNTVRDSKIVTPEIYICTYTVSDIIRIAPEMYSRICSGIENTVR